MKVVVDTNIFVSAAFKELSWPGMVVRGVDKFGGLHKTPATEQEVFDVLRRPRIAENTVPLFAARLRQIFAAAELVTITERITACRDPLDDKFLELVMNGHADLIVSGDADLLVLDTFRESRSSPRRRSVTRRPCDLRLVGATLRLSLNETDLQRSKQMLALLQRQPDQPWRIFDHGRAAAELITKHLRWRARGQ
jgi:putative PIN family toxin of toxin-antitoxin system